MFKVEDLIIWCNLNCGFLTLLLFLITILWGCFSGFFTQVRKKPKFQIEMMNELTFATKMATNRRYKELDCFRTIIVIYLNIGNVGTAASGITDIQVAYKRESKKNFFEWNWLRQHISLLDFTAKIGQDIKVYPFFTQKNTLLANSTETYLNIGQSKAGVVYFESEEYCGGYEPRQKNNKIQIKVKVKDVYGVNHYKIFLIPILELKDAQKYNEKIGMTTESLIVEVLTRV